ncbi:uncharacterized protein EV422DRAFT_620962 [Fimicolochytrium jonesii]|uniref:uncharacterized protein n=1 Tax=Fimicolochytrium jonesii TaxID=1396493 RepID=UPI0022FE2669|nr:uncharacterized protein EV422DRAFT_620962 [Fimicolochytrium jonesii]KAI8819669.1 hypothetical protein EV422DRAFT_620962 [Fimicolochytrium jonesii]
MQKRKGSNVQPAGQNSKKKARGSSSSAPASLTSEGSTLTDYFAACRGPANRDAADAKENPEKGEAGVGYAEDGSKLLCPVCGIQLSGGSGVKVNQHVNQCLDALAEQGFGDDAELMDFEDQATSGASSGTRVESAGSAILSVCRVDGSGERSEDQVERRRKLEVPASELDFVASISVDHNLPVTSVTEHIAVHIKNEPSMSPIPNFEALPVTESPAEQETDPMDAIDAASCADLASESDQDEYFSQLYGDDLELELAGNDAWDAIDWASPARGSSFKLEEGAEGPVKTEATWESDPFLTADAKVENGYAIAKRRPCPWYKRMPETSFTVDAFMYGRVEGCLAYFLTHFHSDHYGGLNHRFNYGPIYCSEVTGNLVIQQLRVDEQYIIRLPMETPFDVLGVTVTLIDANHCPGAVLFVFDLPCGKRYLHTGDFRAHPSHLTHPLLRDRHIDIVYLDTTYCGPSHRFPPQDLVVGAVTDFAVRLYRGEEAQHIVAGGEAERHGAVGLLRKWMGSALGLAASANGTAKSTESPSNGGATGTPKQSLLDFNKQNLGFTPAPPAAPRTNPHNILILVGTYTIGKEKIFQSIATRLHTTVFCTAVKRRVLYALQDEQLIRTLAHTLSPSTAALDDDTRTPRSLDARASAIHLVAMSQLKPTDVLSYIRRLNLDPDLVLCIRPTGWTFRPRKGADPIEEEKRGEAYSVKSLNPTYSSIYIETDVNKQRSGAPIPASSKRKQVRLVTLGVPYSEHSSFSELESFVKGVGKSVGKVVPTVGKSEKIGEWCRRWVEERGKKG